MQKGFKENTNEKNNKKMLSFILVISVGFAVGGLITGMDIIWTYIFSLFIRLNDYVLHIILFASWGAIGGLAIGIAAKENKKLYMLLGGIGLGVGFVVTSPFWNIWPGIGGTGVIIGILEGISLGLYYKKIKSIGVLAVCGAFGFGLGGIIEIMSFGIVLSTISSNIVPVIRVILFVITGLIGGAALGYGTYYLKHPTKNGVQPFRKSN